jgi:putative ABC transport system ATP-binding protein
MSLRLEAVSKDYPEGARVRSVLDKADLRLEVGEFVAIRGRSGCGKTTLLNLAAGIDSPSSGEVWLGDTCLTRLDERGRTLLRRCQMGFVFQFFNLISTLTVAENAALPAELVGMSSREARMRAVELLAASGLQDRADAFPDALSGGEQQRVAVARALVHGPQLVLADEPTGNLDDATGADVLQLLEGGARKAGRTLLLVTHSATVADRADRVLVIEDGRLVPAS